EAVWAEACRELSAASQVPWVLLSAGVTFAIYERQTLVACQAGASGVMAGRAVWNEAAELDKPARSEFLLQTAAARMRRLQVICEAHGRPWTSAYRALPAAIGEDWYRTY